MNPDNDSLRGLVEQQITPWRDRGLRHYTIAPALRTLVATRGSIALFAIDRSEVTLVENPTATFGASPDRSIRVRCAVYGQLLRQVATIYPTRSRILVAIDLRDEAPDYSDAPVFTFQKRQGTPNPLLPDFDLIALSYFENGPFDTTPFLDKADRATFAGSTTGGGLITPESVRAGCFPRLRAARFFHESEEVDFRLTQIVQCPSPEAEAMLRAEGHGTGRVDWQDAFAAKFGLSLDGNGAACSRPAILLASNCVLVKYSSPYVLNYFSALRPGEDFIEVSSDDEVLAIVREERERPGRYAHVAENGRRFAEQWLSRKAALAYTGALLSAYEDVLDG